MADWKKDELVIDRDFEVDGGCETLSVSIETWFDAGEKFGIDIYDDEWVNLYAAYNPYLDRLSMEYVIDRQIEREHRAYVPTGGERSLVIRMIDEACRESCGCGPKEYLDSLRALELHDTPLAEVQTRC